MHEVKLGRLIAGGQPQRDAIHVAVAPVTAAETVYPGQEVGLVDPAEMTAGPGPQSIGIVDPFLTHRVGKGERFWLLLYPGSITSLRHHWVHPAFSPPAASDRTAIEPPAAPDGKSKAEAAIRQIAETLGLTYEALLVAAENWLADGSYHVEYDSENLRDTFPGYAADFWRHFRTLTGRGPTEDEYDANFFTCSC